VIKILVLINGWTIRTGSGGEYHMLYVIKEWIKMHRVSIIMPRLGYMSTKTVLNNGYSVYFSSDGQDEIYHLSGIVVSYFHRILRTLFIKLNQNPDVIIASSHLMYDVVPAVLLNMRFRSRLVIYVHHILQLHRTQTRLSDKISLFNEKIGLMLAKKASLIFVMNNDVKNILISMGFRAEKIFVSGNGVQTELIDSIKVDTKELDCCFCGRLVKTKGIYDLIEIWQRVIEHFPKSKLVIIGHGPEYWRLLELINSRELSQNIILKGFLPEDLKFSTMKSSKIFISPSYEEGWSIVISEAIACALPIVCYDLSVYKIFGDALVKVETGNKQAMAQTIIDLLSNKDMQIDLVHRMNNNKSLINWETIAERELSKIKNL
jgi:glycosyltransferase involved in cell wall biosynthesis